LQETAANGSTKEVSVMRETYTKPMMDVEEFAAVEVLTAVSGVIEEIPGTDD